MPVSLTEKRTFPGVSGSGVADRVKRPSLVNLAALLRRLSKACFNLVASLLIEDRVGAQDTISWLPLRAASGSINRRTSSKSPRKVDGLYVDLHLPGLDLGQIENVVNQSEQVFAGSFDFRQIVHRARVFVVKGIFAQHLTITNNRVERCAKLMAHIG